MAKEDIKAGVYVQTSDGSTCEVIAPPNAQHMVKVKFIEAPFEPEKVGNEGEIVEDEITSWYPNKNVTHTEGRVA